jgi:DMSO/TMAO reductase YedYZ molybdopterin-dependent catalytic subunit
VKDVSEAHDGHPVGRRAFISMVGLGAAGVLWGSHVQSAMERLLRPLTENDRTGLSSFLPTGGNFRYYSVVGFEPKRTVEEYRLTIDGLVDAPAKLSIADLEAMPQTRLTRDFQCVTGWRVTDVPWRGVKVADVLDAVGADRGATHLRLHSFDGAYTESLTIEQARRNDVIVALEMQGKPVKQEHGGPVRLYVAPMYGYKSIKWLDRIEVVDRLEPGYWEVRGYDVDAWVGGSNGRSDKATS